VLRNHDLVFMKRFSLVILILIGITIALILLGFYINHTAPRDPNPVKEARIIANLQPIGGVFAGQTGLAQQEAAKQAALALAKSQVAYEGTLDGSVIYGQLCAGCHNSGVGGAPKMARSDWGSRLGKGKDTLHKHAIEGFNGMPARGGNPSLSDEQVIATVDWMLDNLK
jgi:cytochrome c5